MPIFNQVVKGGGTTPTGTISITSNGTYDVTNYASASVSVSGGGPTYYIEKSTDGNGKLLNGSSVINLTGITDIGYYALHQSYNKNTNLTGLVNLSGLTQISGEHACYETFSGCTGITSVDMSNVTTLVNAATYCCSNMFSSCSNLVSFDLSKLETIFAQAGCSSMFRYDTSLTSANLSNLKRVVTYGDALDYMFGGCTALVSADLSSLEEVNGNCANMFNGCSVLSNVNLSSLRKIVYSSAFSNAFRNCSALTSLSFPAVDSGTFGSNTTAFLQMCRGIPNITVHFPSNTQSVISTLSGYSLTAPFSASSGTILFDLPATVTLTGADSNTYKRNPKYDTANSLGWYDINTGIITPYYTSGTTDPAVSDTIYSDAACTTPVTIIDSIA